MSNDPAANLEQMRSYLDDARDALGPGHVIVDAMMLSDWCSALARAIGEADGSTLAGQQDAIALLRAEIERLTRERDEAQKMLRADIEKLRSLVQSAALDYLALDGQASEALARATAAEAERDALREALADVIMNAVLFPDDPRLELVDRALLDRVRDLIGLADLAASAQRARAALGGQP